MCIYIYIYCYAVFCGSRCFYFCNTIRLLRINATIFLLLQNISRYRSV